MTTIDIMMTMTTNFFFVSFYWQLRSQIGANNGAKVGYTKNRMWPTWVIDPQIALKSKLKKKKMLVTTRLAFFQAVFYDRASISIYTEQVPMLLIAKSKNY